jgi:hypothetical protein
MNREVDCIEEYTDFYSLLPEFGEEKTQVEDEKEVFISLLEEEDTMKWEMMEVYGIKIESSGMEETLYSWPTPLEEEKSEVLPPSWSDEPKKQAKGRPRIKLDCSVNDLFLHLCSFVSSQISKILSSTKTL